MKGLKVKRQRFFNYISLLLITIAAFFAIPSGNSYALDCSYDQPGGGKEPLSVGSCIFGECGVCYTPKSTWEYPRAEVVYALLWGLSESKSTIKLYECKFIGGIRFCVRPANPVLGEDNYGNKTGENCDSDGNLLPVQNVPIGSDGVIGGDSAVAEGGEAGADGTIPTTASLGPECNPRPQVCAYEDWMDGMDTDPNYGPYHHNVSNEDAVSIGAATTYATIAAAAVSLAPIGAAIGSLIGAIMSKWNHIVPTELGCVERPIAVGPPVWSNDAWHTSYTPPPEVVSAPGSEFLKPLVTLNICEKDDKAWTCDRDDSDNELKEGIAIIESFTLSPKKPSYEDTVEASDGREFKATIEIDNPEEICVYKTKEANGSEVDILQDCVPRPGYIPQPEVEFPGGNKIKVKLAGDSITIRADDDSPESSDRCGILHQIEFCAKNVDVDGSKATCLEGYSTVPIVVAYGSVQDLMPKVVYDELGNVVSVELSSFADDPVSSDLRPPGNVLKPAGTPFTNWYANPELDSSGDPVYQELDLPNDLLVYERPLCYQSDEDGKCLNYASLPGGGVCCSTALRNLSDAQNDYYSSDSSDSEAAGQLSESVGIAEMCNDIPEPHEIHGKCLQYARNTTSLGGDPYFIENSSYNIRQVKPSEIGLCSAASTVVDESLWVRNTPGVYEYSPPESCETLKVQVWGAGAAGSASEDGEGDCSENYAGGSGAYGEWSVPANLFGGSSSGVLGIGGKPSMHVVVGEGGQSRGQSGGISSFGVGNSVFSTQKIIVGGGSGYSSSGACQTSDCDMDNGASFGSGSLSGATNLQGLAGYSGRCNWTTGADGPGGGTGRAACTGQGQEPPENVPGVGGCSNRSLNAAWGKGGHGAVQIRCTSYEN